MTRKNAQSWRPQLLRYLAGLVLAAIAYNAASISSIPDCTTLHLKIHSGGLLTIGRILLALFSLILFGIPLPVVAVCAGFLATPLTGSALTSLAFVLVISVCFLIGRIIGRDHPMTQKFEQWASGRLWFSDLMAARANSGLQWTSEYIYRTPIPPAFFAGFCGAAIRHLRFIEFASGAFLSTVAVIIAYTLAGGHIGCALLDFTHGMPTQDHLIAVGISVVALIVVTKLRPRMSL